MGFGIKSGSYYGSKSRWLWDYFKVIPQKHYNKFVDVCMGSGCITATAKIRDIDERIANDFDINMYKFHKEIRDNVEGVIEEINNIPYDEELFRRLVELAKNEYPNVSDTKVAAYEFFRSEVSMNCNKISMRHIKKTGWAKEAEEGRFKRKARNLRDFSKAMQGVELLNSDCLIEIPKYIHDENNFIFMDSPYDPEYRTSEKVYRKETDHEWHKKFLHLMQEVQNEDGGIKANMMICGYLGNHEAGREVLSEKEQRELLIDDLRHEMYCKMLMPLGFNLLRIKKTVKPTVNMKDETKGRKSKKSPAIECIFTNYEVPERAFMTISRKEYFTYEEVFGSQRNVTVNVA